MSESPFVNRLGDALEEAFAAERERTARTHRVWWRRPRLVVALAVVAIGCGAAAAGTLISSSTLAMHPVECVAGTTFQAEILFPENGGSSPRRICARALNVSERRLVACAGGPHTYVSVFYAAGAHQCRRLGLQPLPPSYRVAQAKVQRLARALEALQASAYCVSPARFAATTRRILRRLGFTGWQVFASATAQDEARVIGGGDCAQLPGAAYPSFRPNIMYALDPDHRQLTFDLGPPPKLTKLVQTLAVSIGTESASRCWSENGLKALIRRRLAARRLRSAFAFRAEPPGETFNWPPAASRRGQERYDHGCPVLELLRTAAGNHRLVDALIFQRDAARPPGHGLPPQPAFRP